MARDIVQLNVRLTATFAGAIDVLLLDVDVAQSRDAVDSRSGRASDFAPAHNMHTMFLRMVFIGGAQRALSTGATDPVTAGDVAPVWRPPKITLVTG